MYMYIVILNNGIFSIILEEYVSYLAMVFCFE